MKEYIQKYAVSMYYICKEKIHGNFVETCKILKKQPSEYRKTDSDSNGRCTCLTLSCLNTLVDKAFDKKLLNGQSLESKKECGAIYDDISISNNDLYFNKLLEHSELNYKNKCEKIVGYFKDIKLKIDIIICFSALNNNGGDIDLAISIMFGKYYEQIKQILSSTNHVYIYENISEYLNSHMDDRIDDIDINEFIKVLKQIYKCYEIVNSIISEYPYISSYTLDFSSELFKEIKLIIYDENNDFKDIGVPKAKQRISA